MADVNPAFDGRSKQTGHALFLERDISDALLNAVKEGTVETVPYEFVNA